MHTIGLFNSIADANQAAQLLKDKKITSEIINETTPSGENLAILKTDDAETESALAVLAIEACPTRLSCPNCGSGELDYPGTPNHTFLSRAVGNLALKTHLIEKHVICSDCRHEWTP